MRKILILTVFLVCLSIQTVSAQSIRPLGLTIETVANFDNAEWRWTPMIGFRLVGPVESGNKIVADFTLPNGSPFVTLKCDAPRIEADESSRVGFCGFNNPEAAKAINQTGIFGFQIKLNDKVLYSGKFKVGKNLYNFYGTPDKNKQFYYFVDNDFRLGYSFVSKSVDEIYAEVWLKNKIMSLPGMSAYLFKNGKEVEEGTVSFPLNLHAKENNKESYGLVSMRFSSSMESSGEYEIKVKRDSEIVRSVKFTVGADGKLVNNNIGRDLINATDILVPAQILGTSDGTYNKLAWKDGIFGNPISNLIVP